jgi:hypothetical protein
MVSNNRDVALQLTAASINKTFGEKLLPPVPEQNQQQQMLQKLARFVHHLLQNEMQRLLQALYRIDVDEQKVKNAFRQNSAQAVAAELATLIFEREMQRVITRQRYSSN